MTLARPMTKAQRARIASRARRDAARDMLSDGFGFRETQRITGLGNAAMFAIRGPGHPQDLLSVKRRRTPGGS